MKRFYFLLASALFCTFGFSQNETSKWYFGNNAGLNFMTNPPTAISGGLLTTSEGCSGMSDGNGNLLFYTDGITVWNASNAVMANGNGLQGDPSTTQAAVVVKQPGNANIYYIFTMACCNSAVGLKYSIVDMSLASGMGSVTVQNATLAGMSTERLTSVRHCNGTDTWVLSQDATNGNFRANLVTAAGVNTTAVISSIVTNSVTASAYVGYMKFSPNGRKLGLAAANDATTGFEIYDFDPATGIVSNRQFLIQNTNAYGVEFSPDGSKFYGAMWGGSTLYQWDMCAGSPAAIASSMYTTTTQGGGALQLAKDGKIYMTRAGMSVMGNINNPNVMGSGMNYTDNGQSISPGTNSFGLPNFITSGLRQPPAPFTYTGNCQSASFTAPQVFQSYTMSTCSASGYSFTGMSWNFGDPSSGASNTSTVTNPTHQYSAQGNYMVKLTINYSCTVDTIKVPVSINGISPSINVAGTFTICKGQAKTYTVSGANTYSWSSGPTATVASLSPTITTVYNVSGTSTVTGCKTIKSFTVTVSKCTGIDELSNSAEDAISIYPNPVSGILTLDAKKELHLVIYSQLGALVYDKMIPEGKNTLDMSQFSSGIYTAKVIDGVSVKFTKLIKTD